MNKHGRYPSDVDWRVLTVQSVMRLTFPEVEPTIDDATISAAVENWPTKRHAKWAAVRALLRAMGLYTANTEAVRKGIQRAREHAAG